MKPNLPPSSQSVQYVSGFILDFQFMTLSQMSDVDFCTQAGGKATSRISSCWPVLHAEGTLPIPSHSSAFVYARNANSLFKRFAIACPRIFTEVFHAFPHSLKF